MKKILVVLVAMFVSLAVIGQEQTQNQTQNQTQIQTRKQSGDPIMTQERVRINEGQGTMTRAEKRAMRKENRGTTVSETAQGTSSGPVKGKAVSGVAKQKGIQQQDRDRVHKPDNFGRPTHQARPIHSPRPVTPPRGGRK